MTIALYRLINLTKSSSFIANQCQHPSAPNPNRIVNILAALTGVLQKTKTNKESKKKLEFVWHVEAKRKNFEVERCKEGWMERRNG